MFSQNEGLWVSLSTGGSTQDEIVGSDPPLPPEEKLIFFVHCKIVQKQTKKRASGEAILGALK